MENNPFYDPTVSIHDSYAAIVEWQLLYGHEWVCLNDLSPSRQDDHLHWLSLCSLGSLGILDADFQNDSAFMYRLTKRGFDIATLIYEERINDISSANQPT